MVALSVMVLGWISLFQLPLEYMPNLTWPAMYVNVNYPSSSPEEVERNISRPIEEIMGTLSAVKSLSSSSYANRSWIRLEFDLDADMDLVAVHIRDRLDQVRNLLPDDVERIEIRRWNAEDFPILESAVTWGRSDPEELVNIWKQTIYPRLQRLEGVGSVEIEGAREIGLPVVAASLKTICVFVPMIFITDSRSSLFMRDFAVTVIISVIASLLVALTLIPLAASRAFTDRGRHVDIALKALISIVAVGGISHTIYHTGTAQSFAWITDNIAWLLGGFSTLPPTTWAAVLFALSIPVFLVYRFRKVGYRQACATVIGSTLNYRWSTVAGACVLLAFGFHI